MNHQSQENLKAMRRLRLASIMEGATLLILLGIATPLKHLAGLPQATSVMGPIHGFAFLVYLWLAIHVASSANWKSRDIARVVLAAFVPFGGFFTAKFLSQEVQNLQSLQNELGTTTAPHP